MNSETTILSTASPSTGQVDDDHHSNSHDIIHHNKYEMLLNAISVFDLLIIVFGTIGNLISFYLLLRKKLRTVSSMRYLAALTIVDCLCLYGWYLSSVYRQLNGHLVKRLENISPALCKGIAYLSFSSLQLSSLLLCMLTIDRLLIIVSSVWRTRFANPRFATNIIALLVLVVCALNTVIPLHLGNHVGNHKFFLKNLDGSPSQLEISIMNEPLPDARSASSDEEFEQQTGASGQQQQSPYANDKDVIDGRAILMYHCYDDNDKFLRFWNKLHLCLYSLIPFPLLCILNLIVIHKTREAATAAAQINLNKKRFKSGQQFVTRLLLFLTLSFLLTTLPSTVVYAFWHGPILKWEFGRVVLNLLNTLQFSRHCSNWIIYVYSSSFMREEFKKCIACTNSEYELAAQAALAERPSVAVEILRQLEMNETSSNTFDPDYYYNYTRYNLNHHNPHHLHHHHHHNTSSGDGDPFARKLETHFMHHKQASSSVEPEGARLRQHDAPLDSADEAKQETSAH